MTITIPIGDRLYEIAALSYHSDSESVDLEIDPIVQVFCKDSGEPVTWTSYAFFLEDYASHDDTSIEAVMAMVEDRFYALYEDNRRNDLANYL